MIKYLTPKPHPLCGHYMKFRNKFERFEAKQIADNCGFKVVLLNEHLMNTSMCFMNDMTCRFIDVNCMSGQEIVIEELRLLEPMCKIELPCEMEVSDNGKEWTVREVIGFFEREAVTRWLNRVSAYQFYRPVSKTYKRINEINLEMEKLQKELEELNNEVKL